jgi:hypothetical protein
MGASTAMKVPPPVTTPFQPLGDKTDLIAKTIGNGARLMA